MHTITRLLLVTTLLTAAHGAMAAGADWSAMSYWIGKYPSDQNADHETFLRSKPIGGIIKQLLPHAELKLLKAFHVEAKVRTVDDYIVANMCRPHDCPSDAAMIVVDPNKGRLWVGMFSREEHRVATRWYGNEEDFSALPANVIAEFTNRH